MRIFLFLTAFFILISPNSLSAQNAIHFDGVNDYVQTTFGGVFGSNNRTFEAWVKISSSASGNNCILDYGLNAVGSRNTFLINDNNQLAYIAGGTNTNFSSSANAITRDVWTHVAMVMDNGTGYLFVNGVQVGTGNLSGVSTPAGNTNLRIGQRVPGGSIPFLGEIDEVRIWNIARSASEIQSTMNSVFCSISSNLLAYYQFDQGIANGSNAAFTTLNDITSSGNNGTLTNFALTGTISNWVTGVTLNSDYPNAGVIASSGCTPFITLGNQILNSSGIYEDTVITASGCDSIYTLGFTALNSTFSSFNIIECDLYIAPSGVSYTSSGIFNDTIQNSNGCDSIMTIDLTINTSSQSNLTISTCNNYVSPSGKLLVASGVYNDTIASTIICDSIITIDLTIKQTTFSSISPTVCLSYTSPSGIIYNTSGFYNDTIINNEGCDSIISINLTIDNNTLISQNQTACDSFISPSGNIWTTSGVYQDTVLGGITCASIYTIDLTVNTSKNSNISENACEIFTSNLGNTYNSSGIYTETTQTISGCDSTITIDLTIIDVDSTITQNGLTLTAIENGNAFQWYHCEDATLINGETSQSFTPTENGSYYVEIQTDYCSFNSECFEFRNVSISSIEDNFISLYPNPTNGKIHLDFKENYENVFIKVLNIEGKTVESKRYKSNDKIDIDINESNGLYTILIYTDFKLYVFKVLKMK